MKDIFDIEIPELNSRILDPVPTPLLKDRELYNNDLTSSLSTPTGGFDCLKMFPTPLEFEAFFDPNINSGAHTLYTWQAETLKKLGDVHPTNMLPFKFCLCAANGSGKDAYVIAPTAVWFICCKIKSLVIITSSSGTQLTTQTEKYIVNLCHKVNAWSSQPEIMGRPIIKITRRRITCLLSGSEIMLFATDEASKAEGYHPTEPGAEMMIIVNEAKTVTSDIFGALRRCTGFNYWLNVSTPGEPRGDFYVSWKTWKNKRKVTYYDCNRHQSPEEFEEDKNREGMHSPFFRSKWLAEFTFIDTKTVVNQAAMERLWEKVKLNLVKHVFVGKELRVGLDIALSGNGDETVTTLFRGNKQIELNAFRNKDATQLAENLDKIWIEKYHLKKDHSFIFADDGGVGRAVIDILVRMGWVNINRVLNQSRAKKRKMFKNRGAEIWYKFAKLIEHEAIILLPDAKLFEQISGRKFKESTEAGIDLLTLQSKRSVIAEGLGSPDRADATVLALTDYESETLIDEVLKNESKPKTESNEETAQRLTNSMRKMQKEKELQFSSGKKSRLSLDALLSKTINHRNRYKSYERN